MKALATTQFPQPPVFYQEASPGVAPFASLWVKADGTTYVYAANMWIQINGGAGAIKFVSPYNPLTWFEFTPEGGIRMQVNGNETINYQP